MNDTPEFVVALRKEASRINEDAIISAKRHFVTGAIWTWIHYLLGLPATLLAGGTAAAAFKAQPDVAAAVGIAAAFLSGLLTFLKPAEKCARHRDIGNQYLAVRNDAWVFEEIESIAAGPEDKKYEHLHKLQQRRNDLNRAAPPTPALAYAIAQKGLAKGEASYRVDRGIR